MTQIIVRARQSHLLTNYLADISSSSAPLSSRILQEVSTAWTAYFYKTLSAALPSPPSPEAPQSYETATSLFAEIRNLAKDPTWVEKQKERDEKFSMYLTSVTLGYEGLGRAQVQEKKGETSLEAATALVESNRDAVGLWLDKQVSKNCSLFFDILKE